MPLDEHNRSKVHHSELKKLHGKEFDETYIIRMSMHYEDGIKMRQKFLPEIVSRKLRSYVKTINEKESKGIKLLNQMDMIIDKK